MDIHSVPNKVGTWCTWCKRCQPQSNVSSATWVWISCCFDDVIHSALFVSCKHVVRFYCVNFVHRCGLKTAEKQVTGPLHGGQSFLRSRKVYFPLFQPHLVRWDNQCHLKGSMKLHNVSLHCIGFFWWWLLPFYCNRAKDTVFENAKEQSNYNMVTQCNTNTTHNIHQTVWCCIMYLKSKMRISNESDMEDFASEPLEVLL